MLNFLFSDLVSIFNIATVNPWKQKGGGGLPPLGGVRAKKVISHKSWLSTKVDDCKKRGFHIFKNTTLNPIEHSGRG